MSDWLEHTVQVEVAVPIEQVWGLWSSLEKMPQWMRWIDEVSISPEDPEISRWKLSTAGLDFSWNSRITKLIPHQIIRWESIDGLPNRGAIRFYDRKPGVIVKLTVAYDLPGGVGSLMDNLFLGRLVESNLQADLERFKAYAIAQA